MRQLQKLGRGDIHPQMRAAAAQRTTGYALMLAAVLAYFARPWSCGFALAAFSPADAEPFANFDRHGFGVAFGLVTNLVFAAPVLWLASRTFLQSNVKLAAFGAANDAKATGISIVIAAGLALPTYSQTAYLLGLPIRISMPVLISSLAWLLVVEAGRRAAINGAPLSDRAVHVAAVLALVTAVPKLLLLGAV